MTELRAPEATLGGDRWRGTVSGYFDDPQKLVAAIGKITSAEAVWIVPNPVNRALLARAANRLEHAKKGRNTSDHDIMRRLWLLVDCDPVRPAGISATNEEHDAALALARLTRDHLAADGWPDPVFADSGNGAHLMYRVASIAGGKAAAVANRKAAKDAYTDLLPLVGELRQQGRTQMQIAAELNRLGHTTRRGKAWSHVQVLRLLRRMAG